MENTHITKVPLIEFITASIALLVIGAIAPTLLYLIGKYYY